MSTPGVVVVPDRPGADASVREYAEELAMAGFAVDPVDPVELAHLRAERPADGAGTDLAEPDDGEPDDAAELALVAAAVTRLRDAGSGVVGAVGFARGGRLALRAAREGRLDAVVAYGAVGSARDGARTACPIQLHLAAGDPTVRADLAAYVAALEAAGTAVDHFTYPDATDLVLGDAARARTIGFLHARLAR